MVPVATLLGTQHYKASTGFSSPNKHRTTIIASLTKSPKKKLSPIKPISVFIGGPYGRLAIMLNTLSSLNIEIIIIIIIIIKYQ